MSWLSDRLGIHLNLRPLAAPAGALVGGLLGGSGGAALGAGLMKTADNKLHGDSWGHALGQGALNAGIYGIGAGGIGALKDAFGGARAAGDVAGAFTPSSATGLGGGAFGMDAAEGAGAAGGGGGNGFLSALGSGAKGVGRFIEHNPQAVSGALQGAGQIGAMGSENAMRKAQTTSIDLNNQQSQYEMEAKKRRDAALAPLLAAFQGMIQNQMAHPSQVAKNPYV